MPRLKKPAMKAKQSAVTQCASARPQLEDDVVYPEDNIGELVPVYDEDNVAFETAEMHADTGRFGFPMFLESSSRSAEYERLADDAMEEDLSEIG